MFQQQRTLDVLDLRLQLHPRRHDCVQNWWLQGCMNALSDKASLPEGHARLVLQQGGRGNSKCFRTP